MSVIYKIYCLDENITDCYIGSTNDLEDRIYKHKFSCNTPSDRGYNYKVYKFIRNNGGFTNFDFMILEQFNTIIDKQDLFKIEGQYIKTNNTNLNDRIAGRTKQEYKKDNQVYVKQMEKEKNKKWNVKNKIYYTEYYIKNKKKLQQQKKIKYEENKKQINEENKKKVECEFCKSLIRKTNLKRHQNTDKCKNFQTIIFNP